MPIDPAIIDAHGAAILRGMNRQSDFADQQGRDTASLLLFDQRSLSAAVAREVAMAPNSQDVANLNTAIRTPNTIDHYAMGAGSAAPGAPASAAAAK